MFHCLEMKEGRHTRQVGNAWQNKGNKHRHHPHQNRLTVTCLLLSQGERHEDIGKRQHVCAGKENAGRKMQRKEASKAQRQVCRGTNVT